MTKSNARYVSVAYPVHGIAYLALANLQLGLLEMSLIIEKADIATEINQFYPSRAVSFEVRHAERCSIGRTELGTAFSMKPFLGKITSQMGLGLILSHHITIEDARYFSAGLAAQMRLKEACMYPTTTTRSDRGSKRLIRQ